MTHFNNNPLIASDKAPSFWLQLAEQIKQWGKDLGFQHVAISDTDPQQHKDYLAQWLEQGYQGEMSWMAKHQALREDPSQLVPNALRVISFRLNYLPADTDQIKTLKNSQSAYISRYALGRDYHKLIRKRLASLGKRMTDALPDEVVHHYRPFVDSAPVLEKAFAEKAGLGWIGKHTLLLNAEEGSWFFLGELITNLPLPVDKPHIENQCGSCEACLKVCPTDAFVGAYQLDAKRCISYLTIELKGSIPTEFREAIGNRVFGCDDCQLICPWNKLARPSKEKDFSPRHQLDKVTLIDLFSWSEEDYLRKTEGSPIRRIGYDNWLRNLAIGLGNIDSQSTEEKNAVIHCLQQQSTHPSAIVQEHIAWAIQRQQSDKKRKRKVKRPQKND